MVKSSMAHSAVVIAAFGLAGCIGPLVEPLATVPTPDAEVQPVHPSKPNETGAPKQTQPSAGDKPPQPSPNGIDGSKDTLKLLDFEFDREEEIVRLTKIKEQLANATEIEVFSIESAPRYRVVNGKREKVEVKNGFHKYEILGSTTILDKEPCSQLTKMVAGAMTAGGSEFPLTWCFSPRHGVRARSGETTLDFVICFECSWTQIYVDGKYEMAVWTNETPEKHMDKVLTAAQVPLSPKAADPKKK